MAKTYIDIVKYMVEARFDIQGSVEKPDIIGAVFGQTEGLLGSELDLRELQKNGKIGRIEIDSSASGNKTYGKLFLPSSLGRVETCILAAAIESVDRVGPFETEFKVLKIEDTRNEKRRKILTRAKELVKTLLVTELPDSREISDIVEADVKSSTVGIYGPESLPAGPDIEKMEDIILVEGRADVINLLRSDIGNCIAIGGAAGTVPKTIISLCAAKETTLFVDGDRGGEMIIKSIMNVADIDFIAKAPDGKEVEELTRKEIIKALRSRIPVEQIVAAAKRQEQQQQRHDFNSRNGSYQSNRQQYQQRERNEVVEQRDRRNAILSPTEITSNLKKTTENTQKEVLSPTEIASNLQKGRDNRMQEAQTAEQQPSSLGIKDINGGEDDEGIEAIPVVEGLQPKQQQPGNVNPTFVNALNGLRNSLRGRLYSSDGSMIVEKPTRDIIQIVQSTSNVYAIVFDGIITQRLVDIAYKQGVREIYGVRSSQITRKYGELLLYTAEHGTL